MDLETNYSPSRWCKRENVIDVYLRHIAQWSDKNRASLVHEEVFYNDPPITDTTERENSEQKFDWFPPHDPNVSSRKAFLFIHGGYWQLGRLDESSYMAHVVTKSWNCHFIAMGYDLTPKVTIQEINRQIKVGLKAAVTYLKQFGVDEVFVGGHSAGAYLALMPFCGEHDNDHLSAVKGCILLSGVYDLTPLLDTTINDNVRIQKPDLPALNLTNQMENVQRNFQKGNVRVLVVVGELESPAFKEQSQHLCNLMAPFRQVECQIIPARDHFDLVENMVDENDALMKMIHHFIC